MNKLNYIKQAAKAANIQINELKKIKKVFNKSFVKAVDIILNCKGKVIFAGKIDKPKISKLRLDIKGIYYIPRIIKAAKLGDAAILKELIKSGLKIYSDRLSDFIFFRTSNP